MHDSCILHPKSPLMQGIGWLCSSRHALWCFSRHQHPSAQDIFYQPVFYATHNQSYPSISKERAAHWVGFGEHVGDALTSFFMMTPRKSSTDLVLDLQILPIPTRDWYQMEGRAPRPPNPLSLSGLGKMTVNLLPNHGRI